MSALRLDGGFFSLSDGASTIMSLFAVLLALPGALGTWHSSDPELLAYETGQLHYAGDSVAAATTIPPAQQRLGS